MKKTLLTLTSLFILSGLSAGGNEYGDFVIFSIDELIEKNQNTIKKIKKYIKENGLDGELEEMLRVEEEAGSQLFLLKTELETKGHYSKN